METRGLVLLAALGMAAGVAVGALVGDPVPGSPSAGGGEGNRTTDPTMPDAGPPRTEGFRLEPVQPFRVDLRVEDAAGPNVTVDVDAEQVEGGAFGLIARPVGEGTGMAERATILHGEISSPGTNGTFVFLARADHPVSVELTFPTRSFQTEGRPLEPVRRSEMVSLSGTGRQAEIGTSGDDLVLEIANQGAGPVDLVDPRGETRDRASPGGEGWALVDPVGTWELTCPELCAGEAQVRVTGYPN